MCSDMSVDCVLTGFIPDAWSVELLPFSRCNDVPADQAGLHQQGENLTRHGE